MNHIEKLIDELCPNGVVFRPLETLLDKNIGGGTPARSKGEYWDGDIPWASVGDLTQSTICVDETRSNITKLGLENSSTNIAPAGSILVALKMAPGTARMAACDVAINQDIRALVPKSSIIPEFLRFYFDTLRIGSHGAIVKSISNKKLTSTRIPIPPLEVQREIVKVLDLFTDLEAELEAELVARRKQYEYYRDQLLTFPEDGGAPWVEAEKLCDSVTSGGTPLSSNPEFYDGDIPWVRSQDIDFNSISKTSRNITPLGLEHSSAKWVKAESVIMALYGATAAKVATNAVAVTTNQACCNLEINARRASFRYVFHYLSREYRKLKALGEGSQSNLNSRKVKTFKIPLPPLSEQKRIADILDTFDALVNDLESGLPAEIEARRKQYEYYRDKLLTFKDLEPSA